MLEKPLGECDAIEVKVKKVLQREGCDHLCQLLLKVQVQCQLTLPLTPWRSLVTITKAVSTV